MQLFRKTIEMPRLLEKAIKWPMSRSRPKKSKGEMATRRRTAWPMLVRELPEVQTPFMEFCKAFRKNKDTKFMLIRLGQRELKTSALSWRIQGRLKRGRSFSTKWTHHSRIGLSGTLSLSTRSSMQDPLISTRVGTQSNLAMWMSNLRKLTSIFVRSNRQKRSYFRCHLAF